MAEVNLSRMSAQTQMLSVTILLILLAGFKVLSEALLVSVPGGATRQPAES